MEPRRNCIMEPQRRRYFRRLPIGRTVAAAGDAVVKKGDADASAATMRASDARSDEAVSPAGTPLASPEKEPIVRGGLPGESRRQPYLPTVQDRPSPSPAPWAVARGRVATAVQLSQRRLALACVLLPPPGRNPSGLDRLARDVLEMIALELQRLPSGAPELRFSEGDPNRCGLAQGGSAMETLPRCEVYHEYRDIVTVDRYGSSDSPPHAELVCSALCRENEIAEGVSSAALTVERNDEQALVLFGFANKRCGTFAPVFCGRPPKYGNAGDRIELRIDAETASVEVKLNAQLLGRLPCAMPFYDAGFGSMCLAAGSDRAGCRLRIESTDPLLFAPERDATLLAAETYARDNPLRFTEASEYYDLTGEDGALARCVGVIDHGRIAMTDALMGGSGRHSALFTVVQQPQGYGLHIGVCRRGADVWRDASALSDFWGLVCNSGRLVHESFASRWVGQQGFRQGDQLELLLDCDEGTLHVKKNGRRLGAAVASRGALPVWEELCWAVVGGEGDAIRIQSTDPQLF